MHGTRSRSQLVRQSLLGMATIMAFSAPATALADEDGFSISVGAFLTSWDSQTRVDGEVPESGTPVDLEGDLGFDRNDTVFRVDAYYRFNEKHRVDFSVFDLSRSSSKQLEREIEWDGEIYPIDAQVDATLDLAIYKAAYTWSFLTGDDGFLGLTGGLYVADIGASLNAEAIDRRSSGDVTAPLPVVGLRGQYGLSEKWSLSSSAEVFFLDTGDYSGSLYDLYAGLEYQFTERLALGVGINSVRINAEVSSSNLKGDVDWRYDGGLLFFKFNF